MLPTAAIDALRYGVPVATAAIGPIVAKQRGMDVSTLAKIAGYTLGGWLAGYAAQRVVFWAMEAIGSKKLPTTTAKLQGLPPAAPSAPSAPIPAPSAARPNTKNDGVREIEIDTGNLPPANVKGFSADAYGSAS